MSTARGEVRQGQRRVRVETTETQSMEIRRRRVNIDSPGRNKKIEKSSKMKIGTDEIKRRLERVWKKILLLDRKHQAWMGFGVFLAFYLMIGYGADFLCNFIGFLYPAYASVKAIETKEKDDDTKWLTYWVVYSTFALLEFFTDIFLFWIPLYWFFKCGFLLYCMVPGSYNGSVKIYTSFIRPFVLKHQDKVDKALDQANEIATDLVHEVFGGRLTARSATDTMIDTAKDAAADQAAEAMRSQVADSSKSD